jgi:hypothetical protein
MKDGLLLYTEPADEGKASDIIIAFRDYSRYQRG